MSLNMKLFILKASLNQSGALLFLLIFSTPKKRVDEIKDCVRSIGLQWGHAPEQEDYLEEGVEGEQPSEGEQERL